MGLRDISELRSSRAPLNTFPSRPIKLKVGCAVDGMYISFRDQWLQRIEDRYWKPNEPRTKEKNDCCPPAKVPLLGRKKSGDTQHRARSLRAISGVTECRGEFQRPLSVFLINFHPPSPSMTTTPQTLGPSPGVDTSTPIRGNQGT